MQPDPNFNPYAPPSADVDQRLTFGDDYVLAERGTRFAAALIDGLLSCLALIPGFVLIFMYMDNFRGNPILAIDRMESTGEVFFAIGVMLLMFLAFQCVQWYLIATSGQSLAKKWLGIKIVRTDGSPCGFVNGVILRSWVLGLIGNFIPFIGGLIYLIDPLLIFGEERRCLHDHIASTRVIVAPSS